MIKKVYTKLKSEGIDGLLEAVYRHAMPPPIPRLEYYPHCKSFFKSKAGLEIGGPSDIFGQRGYIPVYPIAARIDNCNFASNTAWEAAISEGDNFIFIKGKKHSRHQYIAEASNLHCIEDSSYDFILSSHCIEHLTNPLQGLKEWIRILKQNGLIVLVMHIKILLSITVDRELPWNT